MASIIQAATQGASGVVSCHAAHAIVTTGGDAELRDRVNAFEIVTPDGQPVRWALNLLYGAGLSDRVYGPELMLRLCRRAAQGGLPVYLYGGTHDAAERLHYHLKRQLPRLHIAGVESPPFRALTVAEQRAIIDRINRSGARLVFVGLGCPKQDIFAATHRDDIHAVQVCVGAAFDLLAGIRPMAPPWIQRHGLEWAYRLVQEPGRLWRRYLVTNSVFAWKLCLALWRQRRLRGSRHGVAQTEQRPRRLQAVKKGTVS